MEDCRRSKDGDLIRLMIIKMRTEIPFLLNLFLLLERFDFKYSYIALAIFEICFRIKLEDDADQTT